MKSRLEFGNYLIRRGLVGEGVEVGVLFGEYSECLLATWPGTLYMIDPWEQQPAKVYKDGCNAIDFEEAIDRAAKRVERFGERAKLMKNYSLEVAPLFRDGQLDFVFIDGNHRFENVEADLVAWYPKIKVGGVIAGHDFYDRHTDYHECGVKTAVQEFAKKIGVSIKTTSDTSWFIDKP